MGERAKFHVYHSNVSPLRSEKPIFGPVSNNNTGKAALHAGVPVITNFIRETLDTSSIESLVLTLGFLD